MSQQNAGFDPARNARGAVWGVVIASFTLSALPAAAQSGVESYPDRPIRLIDPYPPGGGSGVVARLIGDKLVAAWGRQVIVDSRPGAAAAIGTELAARATPDGYTLVMGTSGSIAMNPGMYPKLAYDPVKDLAPITQTSSQPMIVVLHPSVAINSVKELVAYAKAQPNKLNFSSSSTGGSGHLAGELFKAMTKTEMIHIPYKGSGPATLAAISGEVQLTFNNILAALPHVQGGKLKAIAITSRERSKSLPKVPTVAEAGVPGYEATSWNGMFAPARTPTAIVNKLNAEVVRILKTPEVRDRFIAMGADPVASTPEQFGAYVKSEIARWGKVIRDNNIQAD
ncbi:MAG TPA: tripartite tricarboxylate transporter substrate binding protein [Burkholderiales bacterium]|nr:tripartite tricarboxylate transporter substrate binding protein [Burkholderiales bacterium]